MEIADSFSGYIKISVEAFAYSISSQIAYYIGVPKETIEDLIYQLF